MMGKFEEALQISQRALDLIHPLHVNCVKNLITVIKVFLMNGEQIKALEIFNKALIILEFHLGSFHPLHSILYSILGHYYLEKQLYNDAVTLFKSSLVCSLRIYGYNHIYTAGIYYDLAQIYFELGLLEESQLNYSNCLQIYANLGKQSTIEYAKIMENKSHVLYKLGKIIF